MIEAWFDGCCEPVNPGGHAAYGAVIKRDGEYVFGKGEYVGHGKGISNNVAEYAGMICVLEQLLSLSDLSKHSVTIYGDSKLVVMQMAGRWKSHGGAYVPFMQRAKQLALALPSKPTYKWIPRDKNEECDGLSKQVIRDRGIEFRIQPEAA